MATRRMFSKTIIDSDEFLEMPVSARLLYFDLGMRADDDGFVNPKRIMRITNSTEDDLKVLLAKKYVLNFENKVLVIRDWKINNFIRPDRYTPTIYQEYLKRLQLSNSNQYQLDSGIPDGIPDGGIGKVRLELGKSNNRDTIRSDKPTTRKDIKFPKTDYDIVLEVYQKLKGIKLQGREFEPCQQAIKTMFLSGRTKEQIVDFMSWIASVLEDGKENEKLARQYIWLENWTLDTIKKKMPEYIAGKFAKVAEDDDLIIPSYAKGFQKNAGKN